MAQRSGRLRDVLQGVDPALYALASAELAERMRPVLVRHGLSRGEAVILLEPELDLHAPLDDVLGLVEEHGIVLLPRLLEPLPEDGERPSNADVAAGGMAGPAGAHGGVRAARLPTSKQPARIVGKPGRRGRSRRRSSSEPLRVVRRRPPGPQLPSGCGGSW
jgi:hypothetical protein